jgi:multimeric flavodoxin WrbA
MKTLLIVYHSMTGGTAQMARAAHDAAAAAEPGLRVRLLHASQAGPEDVLAADGYLFATPENLAAMSGLVKDFFDRSYYAALDRVAGRPYAVLICAGSDGSSAARQIDRIATGWRLKTVAPRSSSAPARRRPRRSWRPRRLRLTNWRAVPIWVRHWPVA